MTNEPSPVPSPSTVDEARALMWRSLVMLGVGHATVEELEQSVSRADTPPMSTAHAAVVEFEAAVKREVEQEAAAAAEELWGEPAVDEDWQARAEAAEAALESERTRAEEWRAALYAERGLRGADRVLAQAALTSERSHREGQSLEYRVVYPSGRVAEGPRSSLEHTQAALQFFASEGAHIESRSVSPWAALAAAPGDAAAPREGQ